MKQFLGQFVDERNLLRIIVVEEWGEVFLEVFLLVNFADVADVEVNII